MPIVPSVPLTSAYCNIDMNKILYISYSKYKKGRRILIERNGKVYSKDSIVLDASYLNVDLIKPLLIEVIR